MDTVIEKDEGMQKQIRSKTASKSSKNFRRKIDKRSCIMFGFHIVCKSLDHGDHEKIKNSKKSSTLNQRSNTMVPGVVSIRMNWKKVGHDDITYLMWDAKNYENLFTEGWGNSK